MNIIALVSIASLLQFGGAQEDGTAFGRLQSQYGLGQTIIVPWYISTGEPARPLADSGADGPVPGDQNQLLDRLLRTPLEDFGKSPITQAGESFVPLLAPEMKPPGRHVPGIYPRAWSGRPTKHLTHEQSVVADIVRRGWASIPILLEALDNTQPSGAALRVPKGMGVVTGATVYGNPMWKREAKILEAMEHQPHDMTITYGEDGAHVILPLGDLCFFLLGQIVNRPSYSPVTYRLKRPLLICSPSSHKPLADTLRRIWGSADPRALLYSSLSTDLATRGSSSDFLQCGAAVRLAEYFSNEGAEQVAARIRQLETQGPVSSRYSINGVVESNFLGAVAHCQNEIIQRALFDFLCRSADEEVRSSCFWTKPEFPEALLLSKALDGLRPGGWGITGDCLEHMAARVLYHEPLHYEVLAQRVLDLQEPISILRALRPLVVASSEKRTWAITLLGPLLTRKDPIPWYEGPSPENHTTIRDLGHLAALCIARCDPRLGESALSYPREVLMKKAAQIVSSDTNSR